MVKYNPISLSIHKLYFLFVLMNDIWNMAVLSLYSIYVSAITHSLAAF